MKAFGQYEIWFITGSQHLYGDETLRQAGEHAKEIAAFLDSSDDIPLKVVYKELVKTQDEIYDTIKEANYDRCV